MRNALIFGRLFLRRPTAAAQACEQPQALRNSLLLYAAWVVSSLIYLRLKPLDFPDANSSVPANALFWLRAALWEPLLVAAEIALTGLLLRWMRGGWLPLKMAAATLWVALLPIATLVYARGAMSGSPLCALLVVWAVPGVGIARGVTAPEWRRLASFLLGLNVIGMIMLIPQAAAAFLHSQMLFNTFLGAGVFWLLACGGLGLRRLAEISLARAVLAFLFANLALNALIAAAFLLGLLPLEVLKALVYV